MKSCYLQLSSNYQDIVYNEIFLYLVNKLYNTLRVDFTSLLTKSENNHEIKIEKHVIFSYFLVKYLYKIIIETIKIKF